MYAGVACSGHPHSATVSEYSSSLREGDQVFHTYTVMAPDPFVAPYHSFLIERTPKAPPEEPRAWRKDEYPG